VQAALPEPVQALVGELTFGEIAALANLSSGYVGNDTGLTHLAAAAGGRTVMILGPSDPARYGPFTPDSLALWRPYPLQPGGVAAGVPKGWTWATHGIGVDEVVARTVAFLGQ
jgi:ADP-heptose:LPS heptosyltransferase